MMYNNKWTHLKFERGDTGNMLFFYLVLDTKKVIPPEVNAQRVSPCYFLYLSPRLMTLCKECPVHCVEGFEYLFSISRRRKLLLDNAESIFGKSFLFSRFSLSGVIFSFQLNSSDFYDELINRYPYLDHRENFQNLTKKDNNPSGRSWSTTDRFPVLCLNHLFF